MDIHGVSGYSKLLEIMSAGFEGSSTEMSQQSAPLAWHSLHFLT